MAGSSRWPRTLMLALVVLALVPRGDLLYLTKFAHLRRDHLGTKKSMLTFLATHCKVFGQRSS